MRYLLIILSFLFSWDTTNKFSYEEKMWTDTKVNYKPIKIEFIIVKDNIKTWTKFIDKIDNSLDNANQSFSDLLSFDREAILTPYLLVKNSNKDKINQILNNQVVNDILKNVQFLWGIENKELDGYSTLYLLSNYIELNNDDIKFLKAEQYPMDHRNSSQWYISLEFTNPIHFRKITANNIGKFLAVILDNEVKMAPRIHSKIQSGKVVISGLFTKEEAKDIENRFKANKKISEEIKNSQ